MIPPDPNGKFGISHGDDHFAPIQVISPVDVDALKLTFHRSL